MLIKLFNSRAIQLNEPTFMCFSHFIKLTLIWGGNQRERVILFLSGRQTSTKQQSLVSGIYSKNLFQMFVNFTVTVYIQFRTQVYDINLYICSQKSSNVDFENVYLVLQLDFLVFIRQVWGGNEQIVFFFFQILRGYILTKLDSTVRIKV